MADGGYDVADYRAHRPGVRHPRRGRGADRRRRARSASARSSTSSRTTSPTSTRGSRPRWPPGRARPSASGSGSAPGRARTATQMPDRLGLGVRRRRRGRAPRTPTARPASGTCTCSHPASPTSTGRTPTSRARARGRPAVLVRPRRRRHPDRLGRAAGQGPDAARGARRRRTRRAPVRRPRRAARRSTAAGGPSPTPTTGAGSWSARCGCPTRSGSPATCAPTSCTRRSTSTSWPARGTPRAARLDRHARSPRTARWARRPPGCCPTTTSPARSPATAARTPRSRSPPSAFGTPTDLALGRRRARAAALLTLALPGVAVPLPGRRAGPAGGRGPRRPAAQDPMHVRSGGVDPGRDGCRVPLPWSGDAAAVRLQRPARSRPGSRSPPDWAGADRRGAGGRPDSTLRLYRDRLASAAPSPRWATADDAGSSRPRTDVLAFRPRRRGSPASSTWATSPSALPAHTDVLLTSAAARRQAGCRTTPRPGCAA